MLVPPEARMSIEEVIGNDMRTLVREAIGRIIGKDAGDAETRIRVLTVGGQCDLAAVDRLDVIRSYKLSARRFDPAQRR
jgi:hypothetical protein